MKFTKKSLFYYIPAIILIIVIIIILINKRSISYEGKIYAAVNSEITIERDKNGIPFVKADTLNDAYFAVGFLHGQDRLPLIEYFRAIACGRLSELTGNDGIFLDKLSLTIGFARKAENLLLKLKSPYIDYFNSYVKGINASKKEFKSNGALKGMSSSDWTAKDVISILLLFEWSESFLNNKKLIFPLPDRLNPRVLKEIIPEELIYQYSDDERNLVNLLMKIRNVVNEWVGPFQGGFAFYISGENMEDGKSVSGFTLDAKMSIFPKWYPVTISLSSGNTINNKIEAVTASGLPFIFFGRNKDISFFGFNLNVETQDFYIERTRVTNRIHQYYRNGTWNNFAVVNENLFSGPKQKNKDELILAVRATDIGPVISDLSEKEEDIFCLTINSLSPNETYINALFDIPLAGSMAKAKNLVWNIHSLPRQYLFTSNDDAVCIYSGKVYQRNVRKLFFDSEAFTDGIIDLSGYGNKLIANVTMIGNKIFEDAPGIIQDRAVCKDTDRYNTFMALLKRDGFLSPKDIAASLNDTRSAIAEKFVSAFIPILEQVPIPSAKLTKIYFNNWKYNMDTESVAATIFNTILIYMIEETVHDETGNSTSILMGNYNYLINKFYNLLTSGNSIIFNDINTKDSVENRDDIFDRAFMKTLKYLNKQRGPEMENWKWGAVHKGHFNMPLAKQSFFEKKLDKFEDVGIAGGDSTIKGGEVSAVNLLTPANVSVLSGIFYLDLQLSFFSLPASQSLDPDSEYFWNFNNSSEFVNADSAETIHKLVLLPDKK